MTADAPKFTDLCWPDGRPKIAPVQGYAQGIPWSLHLKAYNVYCKRYGAQEAMIDLEGRNCRGGFSVGELDMFIPGWRDEVEELSLLRAENARLREALARFRYAVAWTASDAWDHCSDCRARFEWADQEAGDPLTNDEIAAIGAEYLGNQGHRP